MTGLAAVLLVSSGLPSGGIRATQVRPADPDRVPAARDIAGAPGSAWTSIPGSKAAPSADAPTVRAAADPPACPHFPADNVWRAEVTNLPVHGNSQAFVNSIGPNRPAHPDFSSIKVGNFGIPVTAVPAGTSGVQVHFTYEDESDPGPYLIPPEAIIENGDDKHIIAYDPNGCRVYELFQVSRRDDGAWNADSGAIFDLNSNRMRRTGDTSADAAGLSIYAGLVRYEEVAAGRIDHALRVTVPRSQRKFIWPGSHFASPHRDPNLPPMGLRLRLRADVDISGLDPQARVIAEALKRYGALVADNGSPWFFSGVPDARWDDDDLRTLKRLKGSDFEAVDEEGLKVADDSYAVKPPN